MSSTKRGTARRPGDGYPTPRWAFEALLKFDQGCAPSVLHQAKTVLEPNAGDGRLIEALSREFMTIPRAVAVELDSTIAPVPCPFIKWRYEDFLTADFGAEQFDVAVTNPAFSIAEEVITKAWSLAHDVIVLQRLNFLGSKRRFELFSKLGTPDTYVLTSPRPSFTPDGKADSIEYAWFHFAHHRTRPAQLYLIPPTDTAKLVSSCVE